jgi:hypothetical protein
METPSDGRRNRSRRRHAATWNMVSLATLVGCGGGTSTKDSTSPPNIATLPARAENSSPPSRAAELVGEWDWKEAAKEVPVQTIVTLHPNGKATETYGDEGTWNLTGGELRIEWRKGLRTEMTLSDDGKSLEGGNNLGMKVKATKRPPKR